MTARVYLVLATAPPEAAEGLARQLVEDGLAACVNVVSGLRSVYRWRGKIEEAVESLIIAKTTGECLGRLVEALREMHPYELPEIIAVPVEGGLEEYIEWVRSEVRACGGTSGSEAGGGACEEE